MSSKDIQLEIVKNLDLLKDQGTDYLLITLEPGKNSDRADVWYELNDPDSPYNLIEACLNLFTNLYKKDDLIDILLMFCEKLDEIEETEKIEELLPKKKKKKKSPPPDDDGSEGLLT